MASNPDSTPSSSSPTIFSLAGLSLKLSSAADIQPHIKPLLTPDSASQITHLSLSGNTLGVPACEALAPHLRTLTSLRSIALDDIFTSRLLSEIPPALSALLEAVVELPYLEKVDLSDNAFGLNTVAPLVAFLDRHTPLRELVLNNNGLGPQAGTMVAEALIRLGTRKREAREKGKGEQKEENKVPDLELVICGRNRLEAGSMRAWAKAVGVHRRGLKVVKMVQNGIRQEGIVTLLTGKGVVVGEGEEAGLKTCQELQVLDLQDNTFTLVGSQALAGVVGGWTQLVELGVGDCLLGSRGAREVFSVFGAKGGNKALRVLRAQYNEIDARAMETLFKAVKDGKLEGLRRVEVNGNRFAEDDSSVENLKEVLEERKEAATGDMEDEWGLDDLSDLEDDDDEDEDEEDNEEENEKDEDEEDVDNKAEGMLKEADAERDANVPLEDDKDVDELATKLGKADL
ncbi:Ran GTPase-activating protein 1 [Agyrium rufum]|nr:Ran GTPase-activating protein 1 [Agyrium rufum]